MKKFKNKKILWIIISIIIILLIGGLAIFQIIFKEKVEQVDNYYTISLKNNDEDIWVIKFHEGYLECTKFDKTKICSDKIYEINNSEAFINIDDIEQYLNINNIDELVTNINNFIKDNNLKDVIITSDYNFDDNTFDATFKYDKIENNDDNENEEYFTITFDTDGGSSIDSIVVKSGEKINKPKNPSKDGYTFINWEMGGKEYNFDNAVTNDLTLKAIWKKNNNTNYNQSSSSGSTSNKINISDNIVATVYTKSTGNESCFFYMYPTNLENNYPNVKIETYSGINYINLCPFSKNDCNDYEFALEDFGNLTFNTSKEQALENILKKYSNTPGFNLINFTNNNHKISLEYEYITFNGLDITDGTNAHKSIQNALKNSYYARGTCGGYDYQENTPVTKDICTKFNLNCGE